MKPYLYGILGMFLMVMVACDNDDPTPTPPEKGTECTVLAYLIGNSYNNDLSSLLLTNYRDMLVGMETVDVSKHNLLVYIETKSDDPHLIHIRKEKGTVIADTLYSYSEQNPLSISVMTEVFSTVFNEFPASRYGLVFGSHAEGWLPATNSASRSVGVYKDTQMNIPDFATVLQRVGRHFDYIFFDACFMQTVEVAYELREYADYIIGSSTEIPGPGAPYRTLTPFLFSSDNAAMKIAEEYFDVYNEIYTGQTPTNALWTAGVSVSVTDMQYIDKLAAKTKDIFRDYYTGRQVPASLNDIFYYDKRSTVYYYDFDGFIKQITDGNDDYESWLDVYEQVVCYFATTDKNYSAYIRGLFDMKGATGLSTYIPREGSSLINANNYYPTMQWYKAAGWDLTGWW
ncbi:MAG: clostripain-related cysteine peptidase [Bacteroides sp.]|nr:clostripain-related cysteine peptidase [Bacteroides sp.]